MRKFLLILSLLLLPSLSSAQNITTDVCPGAGCVDYAVGGQGSIGIQITGTWMGTITFQGSLNNSNFVSLLVVPSNSAAAVSTTTANGVWSTAIAGYNTVRVVFTTYTSGTATVTRRTTTASKGGGSTGSIAANPGGADTQVQFNDSGVFGGDAGLTYVKGTDTLTTVNETLSGLLTNTKILTAGGIPTRSSVYIQNTILPSADNLSFQPIDFDADVSVANTHPINTFYGFSFSIANESSQNIGDFEAGQINTRNNGNANVTYFYGLSSYLTNVGSGTIGEAVGSAVGLENSTTGIITNGYGYWVYTPTNSGTINQYYSFYSSNLMNISTNPYAFWYDGGAGADCNSGGVTRINHFGIFAYYNPCFTKYVPAAANFERIIVRYGDTGVFGTDNIAYIGSEEGGTGVMRPLVLMGSSVSVEDDAGATVNFTAGRYDTFTNCADSAGDAACVAASAGAVVIDAGDTNTVVSTTAVTANSEIIIQEDSSLNTRLSVTCNTTIARTYSVTARTAGTSFTITASATPAVNPACLNYKIVN